jgi:hypothetical protein
MGRVAAAAAVLARGVLTVRGQIEPPLTLAPDAS